MTLLDRFRAQSRDKHSDPTVRLSFVADLPLTERDAIAAIAREDEDARVRRAAVGKLMDPVALAAVARDDRDEGVRLAAGNMLRDIALEVFEEVGEAESLQAVDAIADARLLSQIAKSAAREATGVRALARIGDVHVLGSIARHAALEPVRLAAFDRVRSLDAHAEILAVAMNSDFKDTALAAIDLLTDRSDLEQVVARGRNKSAVKRARGVLRDAEERAAREAAEAQALATIAADMLETPSPTPETDLPAPPHGDPFAETTVSETNFADPTLETEEALQIDALQPVTFEPETPQPETPEHETREPETPEPAAPHAHAPDEVAHAVEITDGVVELPDAEHRHARLAELADEAHAAAADESLQAARKRFGAARREWNELASGFEVNPEVLAKYADADARLSARDAEARDADAKVRRDAFNKLQSLLARIEPLPAAADLTFKAAERALRDVRNALGAMPPLPGKAEYEEVMRRLKEAQAALTPKIQELREADDWRRFANVAIQEQLCARMEALRETTDLDAAAREVRELQERWRQAADVPRAQADALWKRFKAAHDEVWVRCEAHFASQATERAENLARKIALCEKAEALADSTDWIRTAEALKVLQAEWKTIGPVSRGREKTIWERFRTACDRFFTRRQSDLAERKATWSDNLKRKEALSERAEALAESTDWDAAAAEVRRLQAEWKTIGPVKKSKSDAIWQRFRTACDRFFSRHAQRHDTARAERVAAREAICAELEAISAAQEGSEAPADLLATARALRERWQQEIASRGVDPERARALDQRFALAFGTVINRWPAAFGGSDLDPDVNRKRMEALVRKIEELAASVTAPAAAGADPSLTPTGKLAAMLKEALAANTIGGKPDDDSRLRAAAEEVRQAQSAFSRIGHVPEDARRQLVDRFQRAARRIAERANPVRQHAPRS